MKYIGIESAAIEIAYDNGGIHRDRSEKKMRDEFARWIEQQPQEILPAIDAWLRGLSQRDLIEFCTGGEGEPEREAIAANAPPFTDDLLNRYFEEVC